MERAERVILTNMCMIRSGTKVLVEEKVGKDAGGIIFPGGHVEEGEPVTDSVIRHQGNILPETVIMVTGNPAIRSVRNRSRLFAEFIPDARGFSVLIPCAFDLERRCGCAPDKILRKTHSFFLPFHSAAIVSFALFFFKSFFQKS